MTESAQTSFEVSAEVISCPGRLGDVLFNALQINLEGFDSPFILTLALSKVCTSALSGQIDPLKLYSAIADALNSAKIKVAAITEQKSEPVRLHS